MGTGRPFWGLRSWIRGTGDAGDAGNLLLIGSVNESSHGF